MTKIVRTPTKATGGITEAERAAMAEHSKLWIARAMRTTPVDVAEITEAIEGLYRVSGLKRPRVVVVPSPLVMAFGYGAGAAIWSKRKSNATRNATYNATRNATDSATVTATLTATYSATLNATRNATVNATYNATRNATLNATDNATDSATYSATYNIEKQAEGACRDLAGKHGIDCAKLWINFYQGGAYWAGYDSYLTAMRDIIGLQLPEHEKYVWWERAAIAAPFRVMHEEFCIVSDFPEILKMDAEHRPHCENGPSHRWRDGWELYHWHGVRVPDEWIKDKALTPEIAVTWANVEQRRAACEILGWANVLSALNARVINKHRNPQIGTLLEVDLPDSGPERFLQVQCGTGRTFALPVPRDVNTAMEAQAWSYGMSPAEFAIPEVRT